jgi:transcriptional regulator with XRE-family HTH domain
MTPFGQFLERIRRDRRLLQKQVAAVMGVTPTRESGMERGRIPPPSQHVLNRLIKGLELNPAEIEELNYTVAISRRVLTLPVGMSKSEYEFIDLLSKHLGRLSEDQLLIMAKLLEMTSGLARVRK